MPTYEQLNQEAAWRAEFVPEPMRWFCREVAAGLGVPAVNIGTKGDNLHLNGGHRSQRWILTSRWCTNRSYTVYGGLPAELMDAIGAVDITPRDREQMLTISRRVDVATRAGQLEEVVAWYGNTNGDQRVDGWDNVRNVVATSDSSHLWHLHLTLSRWHLANWEFFRRLLAIVLDQPTQEDDVLDPMEYSEIVEGNLTEHNVLHWRLRGIQDQEDPQLLDTPFSRPGSPGLAQLGRKLDELKAALAAPVPVQVDASAVAAALAANPTFLAAVATAVNDEAHARSKE